MLSYIDHGPEQCMTICFLEEELWSHILCDGTHPVAVEDGQDSDETEPCRDPRHSQPVDIMDFIRAHAAMAELLAGDWHGSECPMRDDDTAWETAKLAVAVPAVADEPCECGAFYHTRSLTSGLLAIAERYGPDHEATRLVAKTWSKSARFDPRWLF